MSCMPTVSASQYLLAVFIGLAACVPPQSRPQAPGSAPLIDDERDVGEAIEAVNALGAACEVTQQQLAAMLANCDQGVRDDCIRAGVGYQRGCGTPVDHAQAERYLGRACDLGSLTSCRMQAQVIADGTKPRPGDAAAVLDRACRKGGRTACGDLGVVLTTRFTNPSTADQEHGVSLLSETCRAGYQVFCDRLALVVEKQKLSRHFDAARKELKRACDSNYLDACWTLARTLEEGSLGIRDYKVGADLAAEACRKNHLPSCNALGYMFVRGHGVAEDPYRGAQLFYSACKEGYAPACDSMGEATEKGWGVEANLAQAREFYQRACALGSERSCALLAAPPTGSNAQ